MPFRYEITPRCSGCGLCSEACVVDAVVETEGRPFRIEQPRCVRCGECFRVCPLAAIDRTTETAPAPPPLPVAQPAASGS